MALARTFAGGACGLCAAIFLLAIGLIAATQPACAEQNVHSFVANVLPPDDYLALRSQPSASAGRRLAILPNGALLDVVTRRPDGWWLVRVVASGQEGWALSGQGERMWIACCRADPQTQAAAEPEYFSTPSGNIHCMASSYDEIALRCDLKEVAVKPPPPDSCPLEWGDAFQITATATRGEIFCHGDTVGQDNSHVVQYGQAWRGLGFTCQSAAAGLTCFNAAGHGFTLSRTAQTTF